MRGIHPELEGKSMRKALLALVAVYLVLITWAGYLEADPAVLEMFEGGSRLVLLGLLLVSFAVPTVLTIWLVGLLTRFTHRLAIPEGFDQRVINDRTLGVLTLAFFARAVTLFVHHFSGSNLGLVAFVAPVVATIVLARSCAAGSLPRKALAVLPILLYLAADAVLLLMTTGVRA